MREYRKTDRGKIATKEMIVKANKHRADKALTKTLEADPDEGQVFNEEA
jgi:hypothetical protein